MDKEAITSAISDLSSADKSVRQVAAATLNTCYREQLTPYLETLIRAARKSNASDITAFVGDVFISLPWDQRQVLVGKLLSPINDLDLRIGTLMLLQELPAVERARSSAPSKMDTRTQNFIMMVHTECPWHEQEGFKQCLTDPNPEVRHRSLNLQINVKVEASMASPGIAALSPSQIQDDVPDPHPAVMDRESITHAIQDLGSPDKSIRQAATCALKECPMDDLDPYLVDEIKFKICMAEWRDPEVMQSATKWQRAIRTTVLQRRVTQCLSLNVPDDPEAEPEPAVAGAIARDIDNINTTIAELASSSQFQRQVATHALKTCCFKGERLTPYLETMIRAARKSEDGEVLSFVGEVFLSLPSQESHIIFFSLLDSKNDTDLRVGTLMMLEVLQRDAARVLLQQVAFTRCLSDDDPEVKRRALIVQYNAVSNAVPYSGTQFQLGSELRRTLIAEQTHLGGALRLPPLVTQSPKAAIATRLEQLKRSPAEKVLAGKEDAYIDSKEVQNLIRNRRQAVVTVGGAGASFDATEAHDAAALELEAADSLESIHGRDEAVSMTILETQEPVELCGGAGACSFGCNTDTCPHNWVDK